MYSEDCGLTETGIFAKCVHFFKFASCRLPFTSTRSSPDRSYLYCFGSPTNPWIDLWIKKDVLSKLPSWCFITKNLSFVLQVLAIHRSLFLKSTLEATSSTRSAHDFACLWSKLAFDPQPNVFFLPLFCYYGVSTSYVLFPEIVAILKKKLKNARHREWSFKLSILTLGAGHKREKTIPNKLLRFWTLD